MDNPEIDCPKCDGSGKVTLSEELFTTLKAVRKCRNGATAPQIYSMLAQPYIVPTAINRRLEDLRKLGLVTRIRKGKSFVYTVCLS